MKFPSGNYDPEQLKILEAALNLACAELRVADTDLDARDRLARALLDLGRAGQLDVERLKTYAVSQYRAKK